MEKIIKIMSSIEHDKLLHSFYGTLIFALMLLITNSNIAMVVVIVIAICKEVYDELIYGGFDWNDIIATILIPTILMMVVV